ncbi:MAG: Do family serine endopeptidase [Bacteroidota bacterium]|nr:Do family serine endopeptidase [Bacteroidota bacterium]
MKKYVVLVLVALAGGATALGVNTLIEKNRSQRHLAGTYEQLPVRQASYLAGASFSQPDFEDAAEISVHAVVNIKTEAQRKSSVYDDFFDFFNMRPREEYSPYSTIGSGVIISSDGYIVTNNHVVQDADKITVTLNDKRVYQGTIVGTDPATDLAVIQIDEKNLPFLQYGNSDDVRIGQWVLAVGNPFNLTSTVTAGIVSAKARDINILGQQGSIESFIQTDAAVNPGNSGGALVNLKGQLIGINAAIASGTGNYVGYSFAIPVNIVKKVVGDIVKGGRVQRAYLGISYREIDDQFAKDKGLSQVIGVYVEDVTDGGAAGKAGLKKGDVIFQLDSLSVNSKSELMEVIAQHAPGDKIKVSFFRDGKKMSIPVVLLDESSTLAGGPDKVIIHGATFQKVTDMERKRFQIEDGYKIVHLDNGLLRNAGIREGFIVVSIDKKVVRSAEDLKDGLTSRKGGVLIEGVYPNGMRAYYGIGL